MSEWELNTMAACLCAKESLSETQPGEITKDLRMRVRFPSGYTFWGGSSAEATRAMRRFLSSTWRFFRPGSISATTIKLPRTVLWNSAAVVLPGHQENRGNWWGRFGFTHRVRKNPTGESRGAGAGGVNTALNFAIDGALTTYRMILCTRCIYMMLHA